MHYHTVNKHLKNLRVHQRQLKDLAEATARQFPVVAEHAQKVVAELDILIDKVLEIEYEY